MLPWKLNRTGFRDNKGYEDQTSNMFALNLCPDFQSVCPVHFLLRGKSPHSPLLQCGTPPIGDRPSQTSSTSMGPFCRLQSPQVTKCSSMGFPQCRGLLWEQAPAPPWDPPQAADGILPYHWSLRTARCQPDISLQAEGKWLLWCAYPAPFSLTSVSTWVFLSCPTLLQNKMNSQNKCNSSSGLFPFKYVITETLIGAALGRGGTDLKPEMLLKGTYKEACQQPPLPLPNPTRHKPDPQLPDQMFWEFIVSRKRSSKDYNMSLYSTVKTCKRKRHHSTSTSAF